MAKKYGIKFYSLDGDSIWITEDSKYCMDLKIRLFDTEEDADETANLFRLKGKEHMVKVVEYVTK